MISFILVVFCWCSLDAEEIDSFTKSFEWDTAQDVDFEGGYPELFNGGIVDKLTYATISIESVRFLCFCYFWKISWISDFYFYFNFLHFAATSPN